MLSITMLAQRQWVHRSTRAASTTITGSASAGSPLYSSCLYHHHWISICGLTTVSHHWISISGLTLLKLITLSTSLDQHQWTHRSTRAASTTMLAITGSASVDSLLYSSCLYRHHWISISGLTAASTMSAITGSASVDSPLYLSCL